MIAQFYVIFTLKKKFGCFFFCFDYFLIWHKLNKNLIYLWYLLAEWNVCTARSTVGSNGWKSWLGERVVGPSWRCQKYWTNVGSSEFYSHQTFSIFSFFFCWLFSAKNVNNFDICFFFLLFFAVLCRTKLITLYQSC